jgi:hypothetical protein
VQHFKIKFFAKDNPPIHSEQIIPVFHRWIQQSLVPEHALFDVSDYQHVPAGPGILLVANEAHITLDQIGNRTGVTYTRRTVLDGSDTDRLRQAIRSALHVCHLLEQEPAFAGRLKFDGSEIEISVNDRLLAPNNDEIFGQLEPAITDVLDGLWGPDSYTLEREGDARELFRVRARKERPVGIWQLVEVFAGA